MQLIIMNKVKTHPFGSSIEALVYPLLLLCVLWLIFWADHLFPFVDFYKLGVLPKTTEGLLGVLTMPLIHSKTEINHIINNSLPIAVLSSYLIFFYREIALKILVLSWLGTGFMVWLFAENHGGYHIGISGLIYALAGFLFVSGVLRKFLPLQAISLFIAFFYGSMIWGILPMDEKISWEGHLMGLLMGVLLAFVYRKKGPARPKFQYEIEKEMGIEPPDLEGIWLEKVRIEEERLMNLALEKQKLKELESSSTSSVAVNIIYHYEKKREN
jgi:membrane associated rhomboid family serine protease